MYTVKTCNLTGSIAAHLFVMVNPGKVRYVSNMETPFPYLVTDVEPKDLYYPEGWYYAKGNFRNKHTSTNGFYDEVPMRKSNGEWWERTYCTLYED